jgi:hypothetical protein
MFAQLIEDSSLGGDSRASNAGKNSKSRNDALPDQLDDLSQTGYTSHSYRFTEQELRWLRLFCHRASADLDRPVTHNTLMRLLFRLADHEWKTNPTDNRLRDLILSLKP